MKLSIRSLTLLSYKQYICYEEIFSIDGFSRRTNIKKKTVEVFLEIDLVIDPNIWTILTVHSIETVPWKPFFHTRCFHAFNYKTDCLAFCYCAIQNEILLRNKMIMLSLLYFFFFFVPLAKNKIVIYFRVFPSPRKNKATPYLNGESTYLHTKKNIIIAFSW